MVLSGAVIEISLVKVSGGVGCFLVKIFLEKKGSMIRLGQQSQALGSSGQTTPLIRDTNIVIHGSFTYGLSELQSHSLVIETEVIKRSLPLLVFYEFIILQVPHGCMFGIIRIHCLNSRQALMATWKWPKFPVLRLQSFSVAWRQHCDH